MTSQGVKQELYDSNIYRNSRGLSGNIIPNRVFVGGIPADATERVLHEVFEKYGRIRRIKIVMDKFGVSKGYGFITYETEESVKSLQNNANNLIVQNRRLNIAPAVQKTSYVDNSEAQSASGSNIYMANGIPYTYHHGAAFFSTSQQYSPPVAVLSPPPAQPQISTQDNTSYYQVYEQASPGHNFVGSAYPAPTIIYPLQNTVPIFLGNQYQSVPTFSNQNSDFVYNTSVPTVAPPSTLTATNTVTTNRVMTSSVVTVNVESQPGVIATADLNGGVAPQYSNDLAVAAANSMVPQLMENQSVLQAAPNNVYYNMLPTGDVYPVFAVNPQDCTALQYSDGFQSNPLCTIPNNDSGFQSHSYGSPSTSHASHEIGSVSTEQELNAQDFIISQNQDMNYNNGDVNSLSSGSVTPNIDSSHPSLQTIAYFDHQAHQQQSFQQHHHHHVLQQQQQQQQHQQQFVFPEHMTAAVSMPSHHHHHHHIQEYNSTLVQSTSSVLYPNVEHNQNYFINKLYLGAPVTPVHIQYPRTPSGTTTAAYINDRQPRNEMRNNRKRYTPRDEVPDIPRYPFHSTSDNYSGRSASLLNDYIVSAAAAAAAASNNGYSGTYGGSSSGGGNSRYATYHQRSRSYSSGYANYNSNNATTANNNNNNNNTAAANTTNSNNNNNKYSNQDNEDNSAKSSNTSNQAARDDKNNDGNRNNDDIDEDDAEDERNDDSTVDDTSSRSQQDVAAKDSDSPSSIINDDDDVAAAADTDGINNNNNNNNDAKLCDLNNDETSGAANDGNKDTDAAGSNEGAASSGDVAAIKSNNNNSNNYSQRSNNNNESSNGNRVRVFRNQNYQSSDGGSGGYGTSNPSYGSRRNRYAGNTNGNTINYGNSNGNGATMYNNGSAAVFATTQHRFLQSITLKPPSPAVAAAAASIQFQPRVQASPYYNAYTYPPQYAYQPQRKYNDFPRRFNNNQNHGNRYRNGGGGNRHGTRYQEDLYGNSTNNVPVVPASNQHQEPKQIIPRPLTSPGVTAPLPRSPRVLNSSQQAQPTQPAPAAARNIDMCAQMQNLSLK